MSRELLAPPLQRMGNNRCYRVNLVHEDFGGNRFAKKQPTLNEDKKIYLEKDLYADDDCDDDDDDLYTIEELPNSLYKLTMHVAQAFYGGLIGFKGTTKRRIEAETQTEIYVPRSSDKSSNITIKGKTRSSVCAARRKLQLLIASLRKRMRPTHFLGVALNYGDIQKNFIELKQTILEANLPGIDEQLFQSEKCIHLTLGACILLDDIEREKAVELLQSCREYLDGLHTPFDIQVNGLEIMNDDPSAVRVLYASVEAPDLQKFANNCLRTFVKSGLASNDEYERDCVKLHMTVMNNRYKKMVDEKSPNNFDGREILKRFANFHFGNAKCNEVHLCVLKSSREVENFYKTSGSLKF